MKPLLTVIISGTSLAIVAAAAPSTRIQLLDAVVPTSWAQQERGRSDKDREPKDRDADRDRGDRDRDNDRGAGKDKDRDNDRAGAGKDNDRDTDRGGADQDTDRDTDRVAAEKDKEHDTDRGGGDKDKERDNDRGASGKDTEHDNDRGVSGKDKEHDSDRGPGNRDQDRTDRDNTPAGGNKGHDGGGRNDDTDGHNANDGSPGSPESPGSSGTPAGNTTDNPGTNVGIVGRDTEPNERLNRDERDSDIREFAGKFDLEDDETFDDDGFLARRGEIIAMSRDTLLRRRAAALGLEVIQQEFLASLNTTMYRLSVPAAAPIDGILARLRAQDPEGVFDRNHLYDRSAATVASASGEQSHALVDTAKGISVGLIDTGVDALHPALAGTHVELQYFVDESRVLPEEHGTAVVSLLVSPQFGVLPDAQLYVGCVFYQDRRGASLAEARDLVRALDWLMKRRVPVINMSLSGPPNEVLRVAIQRAVEAGHLIVAAVGNGGPASPPLYPAAYDGVIAVTAVDGGQHVYRRATRGSYIELAAMGVDVIAAGPAGPATYSGTSFASPYVAALAAMEYRSLDPQKALAVKETLRENALDLGKPGRDEIYGFGLARPRAIATVAR
jgi:subtilisin family serine protease